MHFQNAEKDSIKETTPLLSDKDKPGKKPAQKPLEEKEAPNLILGYLNLFSDGVVWSSRSISEVFVLNG
jgi:hypothetical protein